MLQSFPARITIVLFITNKVLFAEIEFVQTRNGKTVPVESSNGDQTSVLLDNRSAAAKFITNADDKSLVKSELTVPGHTSKKEFNSVFLKNNFPANAKLYPSTNVQSASEQGKFSFLLDSKENMKYNSKQMANNNNGETTKVQQSTTPDLITNTDVKVLQKFVKKLKSSVGTGEGGLALQIPAHESSKLGSSMGSNNGLRQTTNTQSGSTSYQQPHIQNAYDNNREQYSSNQDRIPLNTQKDISLKGREVNRKTTNNLNRMSKSDIDALIAVAKEWKRLHSDGEEKQLHGSELKTSNEKNNLQGLVINKQSRERANSTPNSQRNQRLVSRKKDYQKIKEPSNTVDEREEKVKINLTSKLPTASMGATKLNTNENTVSNDPGRQLKETVDKAIANTTQQLLQFIKLENQLKASQNGSFVNENKSAIHYTNTFINLVKAMRKSKNSAVKKEEANATNVSSQNLSEEKKIKSKQNSESNTDKQVRLEKQTSFQQTEDPSSPKQRDKKKHSSKDKQKSVQKQITKDGEPENKNMQQTKADKSKMQERLKANTQDKITHKLKQKQQIRKQKDLPKLESQQYKNEEERKKVKAQRQTGQKVKDESHKQENEYHKQVQQKQEQGKQAQHLHQEKQEPQQHEGREQELQEQEPQQQQQQQQDKETEEAPEKISQSNQEKNGKNEQNIDQQEKSFQSPNTSITDEQKEDDVLKAARHFRIKTMQHLIASLAEDPFDTWIYHQKSFDELGITPSLLKAGIANLGSSNPMQHAVRKAVKGQNIKMLVVGGSISAGGGLWKDRGNIDGVYHRALANWWKRTVTPVTKSEMEVNNVAIGGTDSDYFSYCINNFLETDSDIVLWELSANDYNRFNERNFDPSKPLEQLTRIILQLPSHPALIYVNFFRGDKQNFELGEKCPDSEESEVDVLSRYYDIPSLSWRRMVCNLITKRTFVNQELFGDDGYHPNLLGHAQVAMLLMMYIKGVFESVLAEELDIIKKFNILDDNDVDFQNVFQLKIPAFKDPLNPKPSCWTLLTPDYTKVFRNTLNEVNVLKGEGFELRNVTAWDVRTDRIQCLLATKPGAILDLSLNVPVLDDDRNLPLADAQTRTLAIAIHNKFGGAADVQLDELPSKTSVATRGTGKLKQTRVHIVSEDVRPGVHNLRFRSLSPGFCLTSIMVI